jgi:hypothetical protein
VWRVIVRRDVTCASNVARSSIKALFLSVPNALACQFDTKKVVEQMVTIATLSMMAMTVVLMLWS